MFRHSDGLVTIEVDPLNRTTRFVEVDASRVRVFEEHVQFLRWDNKERCDVPVALSQKLCRVLRKNCHPAELPELKGVIGFPPLIQRDGTLSVAEKGYIPQLGWYNASDATIPCLTSVGASFIFNRERDQEAFPTSLPTFATQIPILGDEISADVAGDRCD